MLIQLVHAQPLLYYVYWILGCSDIIIKLIAITVNCTRIAIPTSTCTVLWAPSVNTDVKVV